MHIVCEKSAYLLSFAAHVLVAAAADGSLRAKDHGTSGLRERKAGATFIILGWCDGVLMRDCVFGMECVDAWSMEADGGVA